jgi:hypothetical protein
MTTTTTATPDEEPERLSTADGEAALSPGGFQATTGHGSVVSISTSGSGSYSGTFPGRGGLLSVGRVTGETRSLEASMAAHPSAMAGPRFYCSDAELFALAGVPRRGRVYVATLGGRHYVGALDDIVLVTGTPVALVMSELEVDLWSPPTWEQAGAAAPDVMRLPWHTVERIEAR